MNTVTMRDIAEAVGVDPSTVSRVLGNKAAEGGISLELADRIFRKAVEMRYLPNHHARAVRTGRSGCVALLLSTIEGRSYLPRRLLDGIHDQLANSNQHLTVAKVPDEKLQQSEYVPAMLRTVMSDGLLINYTHHVPNYLVRMVEDRGIPAIWINTSRDADCVYPQNAAAATQATRRLLEMGHRDIAFLDLCISNTELADYHISSHDRQRGYESAMRAASLTPRTIRATHACITIDAERSFLLSWLKRREQRPTAIICYAAIFLPSLLWAANELEILIPRDLSLITFGSEDYQNLRLPVDAMIEPDYVMGTSAVDLLQRKIASPQDRFPALAPPFSQLKHGSVGYGPYSGNSSTRTDVMHSVVAAT